MKAHLYSWGQEEEFLNKFVNYILEQDLDLRDLHGEEFAAFITEFMEVYRNEITFAPEESRKWVSNDFTPLTEYFGISNRCEVDEHPEGIHRHGLARYSKQAID